VKNPQRRIPDNRRRGTILQILRSCLSEHAAAAKSVVTPRAPVESQPCTTAFLTSQHFLSRRIQLTYLATKSIPWRTAARYGFSLTYTFGWCLNLASAPQFQGVGDILQQNQALARMAQHGPCNIRLLHCVGSPNPGYPAISIPAYCRTGRIGPTSLYLESAAQCRISPTNPTWKRYALSRSSSTPWCRQRR
jgi:hypothetical protein